MARYVILAFDDNKEADAFIAAVERANETGNNHVFYTTPHSTLPNEYGMTGLVKAFVRGVYMRPTQFCSCADKTKGGYTRGKKWGIWVHSTCGLPTKAWATGDHWYAAMGRNLLPPSPQAPEWRGDGVAHHRFDPVTKQYVHVETGEPWDGKRSNAIS